MFEVPVVWHQDMPFLVQFDTSSPIFLTRYFLIIIFTPIIKASPSGVINSNSIKLMSMNKQSFFILLPIKLALQRMKEFSSSSFIHFVNAWVSSGFVLHWLYHQFALSVVV